MSAEKIISQEVNDLPPLATPEKSEEVSSSGRVDINILLNRVFAGLTLSLIFVVGLILSF